MVVVTIVGGVLHRALGESIENQVRERITLLTITCTAVNSCVRFAPPFLAIIARGNGTTLAGIGVAVAISELSGLLSPLSAEIVERRHRRTAMVLGLIGVAIGVSIAASSVHPVMFTIGLIVMSQSKVMYDIGLRSWTTDRVPYAQRGRVMGLLEISWAGGLLIGVAIMGLVTAATSWRVGYGLGAAAVLAMASLIARRVDPDGSERVRTLRAERAPIRLSSVGVLVLGWFSLTAASQVLFVTFGTWLEDSFGFTATNLSLVAVGLGFAELCASLTSSRRTDAWGKEWSTAAGATLMVFASVGLAVWHDRLALGLPLCIIAIAVFEFAIVSAIPLSTTAVEGSAARGIALMVVTGTLARGTATIPATRLYESRGMAWPAILTAMLAAGSVIAMFLLHQSRTRRESQESAAVAVGDR